MTVSPGDRVRRILSDGLPPPAEPRPRGPILREVATPPGAHPSERPRPPVPADLLERLAILDRLSSRNADRTEVLPEAADEPRGPLAPPAEARVATGSVPCDPPTGRGDSLEALLGGEPRVTPRGVCWQVDSVVPLDACHGRIALRSGASARLPLRPGDRGAGDASHVDARDAVFVDTETTGLAGGSGTVAFLVGIGRIDGDRFVVRQFVMRDYPEEPALLHAVREEIGDRPLVTFNGRGYDWPLLTMRWRLNRTAWNDVPGEPHDPPPRPHCDLLVAARRLWARTLHSRSLSSLERHVLGLDRGEDLGGARIPAAWFHFLRTGWGGDIVRACRHNVMDVVSLLALLGRVDEAFLRPEGPASHPCDALGTARWLVELGDLERAERCLRAGLAEATGPERFDLQRDLGTLLRRTDRSAGALEAWGEVARGLPRFDRHAYERVAKLLEHALARPAEALAWTLEAIGRLPPDGGGREALEHRAERLRRKVAAGTRPGTRPS